MNSTVQTPYSASLLPEVGEWAAARTGARWEKCVQEYLDQRSIATYVPLVLRRKVYNGRARENWVPLFSGYVFFDSANLDPTTLYGCRKIAQVLRAEHPEELRADLENVARVLHSEPRLRQSRIGEPGALVTITGGPMKDVQGVLVRYGSQHKLVISVRFLGATAELDIDEARVESCR